MFRRPPPVILNLLILNGLVFLVYMLFQQSAPVLNVWLLLGKSTLILDRAPYVIDFMPVQLVTHFFNHGGILHIAINMFVLYNLGSPVEQTMGSQRFLKYYLFCGLLGGALTAFLDPSPVPVVGASGAISGVAVAFAMMFPKTKMVFLLLPFPIDAWKLITGFFVVSLGLVIYNYTDPGSKSVGGVSHFGHLAGMIAALIYLAPTIFRNWNEFKRRFR